MRFLLFERVNECLNDGDDDVVVVVIGKGVQSIMKSASKFEMSGNRRVPLSVGKGKLSHLISFHLISFYFISSELNNNDNNDV